MSFGLFRSRPANPRLALQRTTRSGSRPTTSLSRVSPQSSITTFDPLFAHNSSRTAILKGAQVRRRQNRVERNVDCSFVQLRRKPAQVKPRAVSSEVWMFRSFCNHSKPRPATRMLSAHCASFDGAMRPGREYLVDVDMVHSMLPMARRQTSQGGRTLREGKRGERTEKEEEEEGLTGWEVT